MMNQIAAKHSFSMQGAKLARTPGKRGLSRAAWFVLVLCTLSERTHAQVADKTVQLPALVAEAVEQNPEVRRSDHGVRAAHEVPSRVGSLPDPTLTASLQNVPFNHIALDASPMTGILVSVSQTVPFPGKLGRREEVAESAAIATEHEAALVRAFVALRVKQAYWRLSFAEGAYDISAKSERVINSLADAVHARFSVAQAAQQDALQAEVAHSRLRAMLERHRQAIVSGRRALNGAVGRAPDAPLGKVEAPPRSPPKLDFKGLSEIIKKKNPAVLVARAGVETAKRSIDEAELDRLPDFQVGAGYRFRAEAPGDMTRGSDMFVLTLGMTLPIWLGSKQNARVRETRELHSAAREQLAVVELDALTELQQQLDAIGRLETELQINEREVLPEADQALDASITDYEFGRVGFVSVLRNWQTQLDAQLEYLGLLTERAERLAAVEFLTGAPTGTVR